MGEKIAVIGGDKRELTVIKHLLNAGYAVDAFALPTAALPAAARNVEQAAEAIQGAAACILPMPPLHEDGRLHTMLEEAIYLDDSVFATAEKGMILFTGIATPYLRRIAAKCRIIDVLEDDDIAVPLAQATAEGAVAEAIRLSEGLLFNEQALVIGFGRIGRELAWRLEGLGMEVVVLNRGEARATQARDYGFTVGAWSQLTAIAARSLYIFNTVPALLLSRSQLQWLHPETLIIDLAATPGGTDFQAAAELGVKAVLSGGLPGRFAPSYAGGVMAEIYLKRLRDREGGGQ